MQSKAYFSSQTNNAWSIYNCLCWSIYNFDCLDASEHYSYYFAIYISVISNVSGTYCINKIVWLQADTSTSLEPLNSCSEQHTALYFLNDIRVAKVK